MARGRDVDDVKELDPVSVFLISMLINGYTRYFRHAYALNFMLKS